MTENFNLEPHIDNYCVIGNPISHSKSPQIHQAFANQTNQILHYQTRLVEVKDFVPFLELFQKQGGKGLNITLPFKGDAWQRTEAVTLRAKKAESVNTIWFSEDGTRHGDTTDGCGLVKDLLNNKINLENKRILVLGAGGAVRGVLMDLFESRPTEITIANRTNSRAETLIRQFSEYPNLNSLPMEKLTGNQYDIIINGTSASLKGELLALPDDILAQGASCYDMAYSNTDTVFVQWAKQHGAAIALDGLGMLVEQAAESFYIWRGVRPDTRPVIEMLKSDRDEG